MATLTTPPHRDLDALARRLRSYARWIRDCGSAMIGGGVAVGFGLLISGIAIRRDVYEPLLGAYGVVMLAAAYFWVRGMHTVGKANVGNVINALVPPVLVIGAALGRASGNWPLKPYTTDWWQVVGLAFLVVLLGAWRRRNAEDALDWLEALRRAS